MMTPEAFYEKYSKYPVRELVDMLYKLAYQVERYKMLQGK